MPNELLTLPDHLSLPPVYSWIRATRSLVLCVCFLDRCLSLCSFSFGQCVVWSSSIYIFWLPLWYLQTLLFYLIAHSWLYLRFSLTFISHDLVGLNSVRREILSSVTIVFYDKVRGRNKAQRWLLLVCWRFFIWKRYNRTHFHRTILWLTIWHIIGLWVLNTTFNSISVIKLRKIVLREETWLHVPGETHHPVSLKKFITYSCINYISIRTYIVTLSICWCTC